MLVFLNCDDVSCLNEIAGDINALAVHGDVTVVDELSGLGAAYASLKYATSTVL